MSRILLLTVSGADQTGVTASITAILADGAVQVLDIGQAVIHSTLTLGMLLELSGEESDQALLQRLERLCAQRQLALGMTEVAQGDYQSWVDAQGRSRYIVTLLARKISAGQLARLTQVVQSHGLNIDGITRLSGRLPLGQLPTQSKACVEFSLRGPLAEPAAFRHDLLELAGEMEIDLACQEDNMFRRHRRLVVFDMDSTLIEAEVIDELAAAAGVGEEVAAITEAAMRGELDFADSFRRRLALLEGLDSSVLEGIAERLPVTEGAERLLTTLRRLGYRTAIVSGGFSFFAQRLQQRLGIDYVYANELDIEDGKVTGKVRGAIVDGERKAVLLREIAKREGVELEQVIAVGDGANDLPMLSIAGLGVAFRAKPLVRQSAEQSISTLGLDAILYLLGLSDRYQAGQ